MSYDNNNIFAKIIQGGIPCDKVYENDHVIAFNDIQPAAPIHVLVIPKQAYISFDDFIQHASADAIIHYYQAIQHIANMLGIRDNGYRLISNHGADASQSVPHFHTHILAGKPLGGLLADDPLHR